LLARERSDRPGPAGERLHLSFRPYLPSVPQQLDPNKQ